MSEAAEEETDWDDIDLSDVVCVSDLAPIQRDILVESLLFPDTPGVYLVQSGLELKGTVDVGRLRAAIEAVVERHSALRTTLVSDGVENPVQIVWGSVSVPFEEVDWRGHSPQEAKKAWASLLERGWRQGLDVEADPPLSAKFIRLRTEHSVLHFAFHHALLDGWSITLLLEELFKEYAGLTGASDEEASFVDYVDWLRARPREDRFWARYLDGVSGSRLELPRPTQTGTRLAQIALHLDEVTTRVLEGRSRQLGLPPTAFPYAAWAMVIAAYANSADAVIGTVVSGRNKRRFQRTIGPIIHTLPLRVAIDPDALVEDLLRSTHASLVQISEKTASLPEIAAAAGLPPSELFDAVLVVENLPHVSALQNLSVDGVSIVGFRHQELPHFPLQIAIFPGERVLLQLRYFGDRVSEDLASRLLHNFRAVLERLARSSPKTRVREISLLAPPEEHEVLRRWNATTDDAASSLPLVQGLDRAARAPTGSIVGKGGEAVRASELLARVRRVSAGMAALLEPEDRVLIVSADLLSTLVTTLAAWRIGACVTVADPSLPASMLTRLRARNIALEVSEEPQTVGIHRTYDELVDTEARGGARPAFSEELGFLATPMVDEQLSVCTATTSRGWFETAVRWAETDLDVRAGEPWLFVAEPSDATLIPLVAAVLAGAEVRLAEPTVLDDPARLAEEVDSLARPRIYLGAEPSNGDWSPLLPVLRRSSRVCLGPDQCPPESPEPGWATLRGVTEGGRWTGVVLPAMRIPIERGLGRPISGVACSILDAERRPVPVAAPGRLTIGGLGLARGYDECPALTADAFRPSEHAVEAGQRAFSTECRARWTERGFVEVTDGRLGAVGYRPLRVPAVDALLRAARERYWSEALSGAPSGVELPSDRSRAPGRDALAWSEVALDRVAQRDLEAWASDHGVEPFTVFVAVWQLVLSRLSQNEDVAVAVWASDLGGPPTGSPSRRLPIRCRLDPGATFLSLLELVGERLAGAAEHRDVPSTPLLEGLGLGASQAGSALLRVVVERDAVEDPRDGVDLVFTVGRAALRYDPAMFEDATVKALTGGLESLLERCVTTPNATLARLRRPSESERRAALSWGEGAPVVLDDASIVDVFQQGARGAPRAPAVESAGRTVSYQELDIWSDAIAEGLAERGAGLETRVAVLMPRGIPLVAALLGTLKVGGAYVALSRALPEARLAMMVADASLDLALVSSEEDADRARGLGLRAVLVPEVQEPARSTRGLASRAVSRNAAYVAFTSGSTGAPKGVEVSHASVVRLVRGSRFAELSGSRFLQLAPVEFDASTLELWGPLLNGGCVVVGPEGPPSAAELAERIARHQIDSLWLTAGLFSALVEQDPSCLRGLRQLLAGGDVLSAKHVAAALEALGEGAVLINGYGPTENTTFTTCHSIGEHDLERTRVPIGTPVAGTTVRILDAGGDLCGPLAVGELTAGGTGVARGYLGRARLTAEKFVPDPWGLGGRLYRTGDQARWRADGTVDFLGRTDAQVKIRGFRIELGEVEAHLERDARVERAVAVVHEHASSKHIVAYLVAEPGADLQAIVERLAGALPAYMLPSRVVGLRELPLTASGKVDRRALPAPNWESQDFEAPASETEEVLAEIWRELLGVERVGRDDDFFGLGGHSLLATRALARVQERLGVELSLRDVFETPTLKGAAAIIDDIASETLSGLEVPEGFASLDPEELDALSDEELDRLLGLE